MKALRNYAVLAATTLCTLGLAQSWNLRTDFSPTVNPNGAWKYGSTTSLGSFSLYTNNTNVPAWYQSIHGFSGFEGWSNPAFVHPAVIRNNSAFTRFQTFAPGDVMLQSFVPNQLSVARWTNPWPGTRPMQIDASFRRVEDITQNSSLYWLLRNGTVLASGSLLALNQTATYNAIWDMAQGDTFDLVVGFVDNGSGSNGTALETECLVNAISSGNTYFEDFEDGIANGWLVDHGDWSILFGIYHGIGRPNNGWVHNVSWVPETESAGMSVEGMLSSDPGSDDINKMIVLRFQDPQNFIFVNFRASPVRDVVVEQVVGGVRSLLTPEFFYLLPPHGQTDWKRCRADIFGKNVVAYFEGVRVMDVTLPAISLLHGMAGLNVFSSSGGGDEEVFCDEFSWAKSELATASSLVTEVGVNPVGSLGTVSISDNIYFQVDPAWNVARNDPNIRLVWTGNVGLLPAGELILRFESSISSSTAGQRLAVFDWVTNQYVQVDSRQINSNDSALRFSLDPSRYIGPSGDVKVRATYFAGANSSRFSIKVDEINVQVVAQ